MKTGTTTVGIVAKDCVILAADKRATAGHFIAGKKTDKVVKINDSLAITTAGSVSEIQFLIKLIRAELLLRSIRSGRNNKIVESVNMIAGLVYSSIRKMSMLPSIVHFLVAGSDPASGAELYDIYPDGSATKIDDFITSGSGGMMAIGVLEAEYKPDMSSDDAAALALRAVNSAIQRDSASGDGVDIFVIDNEGVKKHTSKVLKYSLLD